MQKHFLIVGVQCALGEDQAVFKSDLCRAVDHKTAGPRSVEVGEKDHRTRKVWIREFGHGDEKAGFEFAEVHLRVRYVNNFCKSIAYWGARGEV